MNLIRSSMALSMVAFTACGPQSDTVDVQPLGAEAKPGQRLIETGLSTSLAPAEVFEEFGSGGSAISRRHASDPCSGGAKRRFKAERMCDSSRVVAPFDL